MRQLAALWTQWPAFVPIRLHEVLSGVPLEHSDDYVLALIAGLGGRGDGGVREFMLRTDHALREDVFWRIFEVEGGGEVSLANVDKFSSEQASWQHSVLTLVADGTLERTRVLRSCLSALNRDFSAYRAGWFSRVYAALKPSPAEASADSDLLLLCLGSSITATQSLAARQLTAIDKAGLLDARPFIDAAGGALLGPKGTAVALVRLLGRYADADPEGAAAALALALGNPAPDVQTAAAKALAGFGRDDLIGQARGQLAPSVAAALPGPGEAEPLPAGPDGSFPVAAARPVQPWQDDDALERFALLLEAPADPIEVELALAWLTGSAGVAEALEPLLGRARKLSDPNTDAGWLAGLIVAASEPETDFLPQEFWRSTMLKTRNGETVVEYGSPEPVPTPEQNTVLPSFVGRLREVADIVQGRAPRRPLLATATDSHGTVSLDSLRDRQRRDLPVLPADRAQALLRVDPDDLPAALALLGGQPPVVTEKLRIEWVSRGSETLRANGSPQWVWWSAFIHADPATEPLPEQPGLIPSTEPGQHWVTRSTSDLVTAELALVHPPSTLPLVAVGVRVLASALDEAADHRAGPIVSCWPIILVVGRPRPPSSWRSEWRPPSPRSGPGRQNCSPPRFRPGSPSPTRWRALWRARRPAC